MIMRVSCEYQAYIEEHLMSSCAPFFPSATNRRRRESRTDAHGRRARPARSKGGLSKGPTGSSARNPPRPTT